MATSKGQIGHSTRCLYKNLRKGATVLRKIGLYAERYFEQLKEIESLQNEIKSLQKAVRDNPRIEALSRTLELRDRQICELEKQLRQCKSPSS